MPFTPKLTYKGKPLVRKDNELYYGCNPADDVDLERLSASVSCTGYDEV